MNTLEEKVEHAKGLISDTVSKYGVDRVAVSSSFGKDSMAVIDIAKQVDARIPVISIMTIYKFPETFEYLVRMRELYLRGGPFSVYITADNVRVPEVIRNAGISVVNFPELYGVASEIIRKIHKGIYGVADLNRELLLRRDLRQSIDAIKELSGIDVFKMACEGKSGPDLCCEINKVYPQRVATRNLDAWITGLRNTEGRTRVDYKEVEHLDSDLEKLNPILTFTEEEVKNYLRGRGVSLNPLYERQFDDGRIYRSLGCEPCTKPIYPEQLEREGRWAGTSKCGGECGIHTQPLRGSYAPISLTLGGSYAAKGNRE